MSYSCRNLIWSVPELMDYNTAKCFPDFHSHMQKPHMSLNLKLTALHCQPQPQMLEVLHQHEEPASCTEEEGREEWRGREGGMLAPLSTRRAVVSGGIVPCCRPPRAARISPD